MTKLAISYCAFIVLITLHYRWLAYWSWSWENWQTNAYCASIVPTNTTLADMVSVPKHNMEISRSNCASTVLTYFVTHHYQCLASGSSTRYRLTLRINWLTNTILANIKVKVFNAGLLLKQLKNITFRHLYIDKRIHFAVVSII